MSVLSSIGISTTAIREENDFYATDPKAMSKLLEHETFHKFIWEPACGEGNLSEVLKEHGYNVYSTDLVDRGYQDEILDYLEVNKNWFGDIITNPPFKHTNEFIKRSLSNVTMGGKVALFLKLDYLTGVKRYKEIFKENPPIRVYVFSRRMSCSKNNNPLGFKKGGAMSYAWFIWEKGKYGPTELKWII